ncbi:MAG: hypothetical protein AAB853_04485 [Patescibacteria group bacterium]
METIVLEHPEQYLYLSDIDLSLLHPEDLADLARDVAWSHAERRKKLQQDDFVRERGKKYGHEKMESLQRLSGSLALAVREVVSEDFLEKLVHMFGNTVRLGGIAVPNEVRLLEIRGSIREVLLEVIGEQLKKRVSEKECALMTQQCIYDLLLRHVQRVIRSVKQKVALYPERVEIPLPKLQELIAQIIGRSMELMNLS